MFTKERNLTQKEYNKYILLPKDELIKELNSLRESKEITYSDEFPSYSASLTQSKIGDSETNINYICPKYWDLSKNVSIHPKDIYDHLDKIVPPKYKGVTENYIIDKEGSNFREVSQWSQPLISDHYHGLNVFFVKKINNTMHYLCQTILEPGYNIPKFTNTIMQKNCNNKDFLKTFLKKNKIRIKKKLIEVINSDEGGRFNNNKSKNVTYEIEELTELERQNFIWISYNQMLELLNKKLLTIELRNLFGILNIKNLK